MNNDTAQYLDRVDEYIQKAQRELAKARLQDTGTREEAMFLKEAQLAWTMQALSSGERFPPTEMRREVNLCETATRSNSGFQDALEKCGIEPASANASQPSPRPKGTLGTPFWGAIRVRVYPL